MNVLAMLSHPDDAEFFCGGTLMKYRKNGHRIFVALSVNGNIGSNDESSTRSQVAATRKAEQLAASKHYGAEVRFLDFDDQLLFDSLQSRMQILDAIRWASPDVILTNYPHDQSTDHGLTGEIVGRVLLSSPSRLIPATHEPLRKAPSVFYVDTVAGVGFSPEVYVDISAEIDGKLQALKEHASQFAWMREFEMDDLTDACRTVARFRGLQAGCKYAEAYRMHRVHGFMADPRLLP